MQPASERDAGAVPAAGTAKLGLVTAIALVAGNMVGSGLFLLPSSLAPYGMAAWYGWLASALGALALASVFARLARERPASGGPYAFARAAFGDEAGFLTAWSYWVSIWCANAAIAVTFAGYFGALVPAVASPAASVFVALAALWACTLTNALGVRSAGAVQVLTTILKLLPLVALIACALPVPRETTAPIAHDDGIGDLASATLAATVLTLWAFLGMESATVVAEDVVEPRRNLPRATLAGTAIAIVATVLACGAVALLVPAAALATSAAPFADAAATLWGALARPLFAATAAIACFGTLNGWVLLQGRLPLAAARDRAFPALFARVDRNGTPQRGLVVGSLLASGLVLANMHKDLVSLFTFSILLSTAACLVPYIVCSAAALRDGSPRDRAIAAIAFAFGLVALFAAGADALLWGGALLAFGWTLRRLELHRRTGT